MTLKTKQIQNLIYKYQKLVNIYENDLKTIEQTIDFFENVKVESAVNLPDKNKQKLSFSSLLTTKTMKDTKQIKEIKSTIDVYKKLIVDLKKLINSD